MAAFKNIDTGYYIIDCTEIKRKEIETSNRRPEPGCENRNDIAIVDTKKPQDFSNHCLGAFVLSTSRTKRILPMHLTEFLIINQLVDRRVLSADRTLRIRTQLHFLEVHSQRAEQ